MKTKAIPVVSLVILLAATFLFSWLSWQVIDMNNHSISRGYIVELLWYFDHIVSAMLVFYVALTLRRMLWRRSVWPVVFAFMGAFGMGVILNLKVYFYTFFPIHLAVLLVLLVIDGRQLFIPSNRSHLLSPGTPK